jgi:hypothetical protein
MKRAADIELLVDEVRAKRRRLEKEQWELEEELERARRTEALARAQRIPWSVFEDALHQSKQAWREVPNDMMRRRVLECESRDGCPNWPFDGMDVLYEYRSADDGVTYTFCESCLSNETDLGWRVPKSVLVDPQDFEPGLIDALFFKNGGIEEFGEEWYV